MIFTTSAIAAAANLLNQKENEESFRKGLAPDLNPSHNLAADKQAIHESLRRQREQRTKRVKSILP